MTPDPSTEALYEAALAAIERELFGDVQNRSRDDLVERAAALAARLSQAEEEVERVRAAFNHEVKTLRARLSQAEEALRLPRVQTALHATEAWGTMAVPSRGGVTRSAEAVIAKRTLRALAASSAGEPDG